MASGKEIRTKIKSIESTKKITKAMQMVAASKMRRAQQRMEASRPYADKMRNVIAHLAHAHPEYKHPFMIERPVKRVGLILISTDRGLCGGLNINLFKQVIRSMKVWSQEGKDIELCLIGSKAQGFFKRIGAKIVAQTSHLGDAPSVNDLIGSIKVMLDAYLDGKLDALYIASNKFVNTMTQSAMVEQLIPLKASEEKALTHHWDYIYEPDAKSVIDALLTRYIESLTYQGVVENIACEQSARMVAMKSASDNAGDMISELKLVYNKARQASITQEISEIVAGAAAV